MSNPYTQAAGAYGNTASSTTDQRTLEGQVLLKSASMLEILAKRLESDEKVSLENISDTLDHNQKLWQIFMDNVKDPDCPLPQDVKNNIGSLALFVFKRTHEIYIDTVPEKFKALININRNLASGLMKKQPASETKEAVPKTTATEPVLEKMSIDTAF